MRRRLTLIVLALAGSAPGCATVSFTPATGELHTATLGKDVSARGTLPTPNGPVEFEVTSSVNAAVMKAVAEGAATAAGAAVRAAIRP